MVSRCRPPYPERAHGVWSLDLQGMPGRTAPQVIPTRIVTRLVLHLDRDDTVGITRVPFLNPRRLLLEARDQDGRQGTRLLQAGHKREIDLVPRREITRRRAGVGELAAFEVTKMPDGVCRLIPAGA